MKNKSKLILYTDGSCLPTKDGAGGWAYMIRLKDMGKNIAGSGGVENTTNNRMELQAVIEGLFFYLDMIRKKRLKKVPMKVATDSRYVIYGCTTWVCKWKRYGWTTSGGKEVANRDLWEELYELTTMFDINWQWIKAHSGNRYNDTVDRLARIESAAIAGEVLGPGDFGWAVEGHATTGLDE